MSNKRISELPYIDVTKISGNTLVPLVTYFSAVTGDTVHTYVDDIKNYILSGSSVVYTTGATYSNNTFTFINNTGGTFNVSFNDVTGLTVNGDLNVTGTTYTDVISATTYLNLPADYNTYVTGYTYSNNTFTISDNSGSTFNATINQVTGLTSTGTITTNTISATTYQNLPTDIFVTGGTYSNGTATFTNNSGGTFNVTGFLTGTTDVFVTGGTYSNSTGIATFTNNTGGTYNVSGFFKPSDDIYTTGLTFNVSNYDLSITRNDGTTFTQNLGILSSDVTITGGTYDSNTGIATFTNNTGGTFNVTGFLTGMTDTYVTGFTYDNNNIITIKQNASQPDLSVTINQMSGLTINGGLNVNTISATTYQNLPTDVFVTGGTYSSGTATFTNNTGGTFNVTGFGTGNTDTFVTGGTYSNGTAVFTNNTGGTFNVTGFYTGATDVFVTGGTYVDGTTTFTNNTGGTFNVTGYYTGATDVFVTGGTYSNSTGIATYTNNTGGTFNVTGFFKPTDDIFITGLTFNVSNYDLSILRNDGTTFTQNLGILSSDVTITGGTYDSNTGIATFTNNTGGTFNVSGFLTGMTDTYVTGFTYNNNTITIKQNAGQSDLNVTINQMSGLTINGGLSASTISATTYQNLPTDVFVTGGTYSNGTTTFTNNTGGTFNVTGFYTGATDVYVTGGTYSSGTAIFTNNTGGTFSVTGITQSFTGNSSGDCINDIYVSNIHSCSPLNINPLDEGNVYFGSTSGITIDLTNNRVGIGTTTPSEKLEVNGKTKTTTFQMTSGATSGYVLTSDASGNATWQQSSGGTFTGGSVTNFTANTIFTDYIDFNQNYTGSSANGRIFWDSGTGTLNIGVGDSGTTLIDLQVGQEEIVRVYNSEATTLQKGEIVYVSGSQGNRPAVKRALATSDGYSVTTLGMVDVAIPSGSEGYVTTFGIISNLNTLGLTGGTAIWLSPTTEGGYTSTKPIAPNHTVLLGYVVRVSATVGSIFINISNGWELDELHDVRVSAATEGDLLLRSSYSGTPVWVNTKTLPGSYTITGNTTVGDNLVVSGNTNIQGLSATTFSATTLSGDGGGITNISNRLLSMTVLTASTLVTHTIGTTNFTAINLNSDSTNRFAKTTFVAPPSGKVLIDMAFDMTIVNSAAVQMIGLNTTTGATTTPSEGWYRINADNDSTSGQFYAKFIKTNLTAGNTYTYYFMGVCNFSSNTIRISSIQTGAYSAGSDLPSPLIINVYDLGGVTISSNPSS